MKTVKFKVYAGDGHGTWLLIKEGNTDVRNVGYLTMGLSRANCKIELESESFIEEGDAA